MELSIYTVDAFTTDVFAGNPAAVVPLKEWLPDALMQKIGLENNLSETAFFVPLPDDPDHDFEIRWFTPKIEVPLCGHATLASAWVLFNRLGWDGDGLRLRSRHSGTLNVSRLDGGRLELDFPAQPPVEVTEPEGLADALGVTPLAVMESARYFVVLEDEATVRAVTPDLHYIANTLKKSLIITAPGDDCDCASRMFAPAGGIDEDPVTGSAHCAITPYWTERLGKPAIHARQVSTRGGDLYCRMDGDRVRIAGDAVLYMQGRITV